MIQVTLKETEIIALNTEISGLKNKVEYFHNELRTTKDSVTKLTNKNAKIIKENLDLKNNVESLSEALEQKDNSVRALLFFLHISGESLRHFNFEELK